MNIENMGDDCRVDGCIHTVDTTKIDFAVEKFVQTRGDLRQLSSTQFTPPTRLNETVSIARSSV